MNSICPKVSKNVYFYRDLMKTRKVIKMYSHCNFALDEKRRQETKRKRVRPKRSTLKNPLYLSYLHFYFMLRSCKNILMFLFKLTPSKFLLKLPSLISVSAFLHVHYCSNLEKWHGFDCNQFSTEYYNKIYFCGFGVLVVLGYIYLYIKNLEIKKSEAFP